MLFTSNLYAKLFNKIACISKMIFIIGLILKYLSMKAGFGFHSFEVNILFYIGGVSVATCYLFSMFHPIKESPNWNLIFPELNNELKIKKK